MLAGSGTGVRIWLVTTFKTAPLLNTNVITCEREYPGARDAMFSVTLLCDELEPMKLSFAFVSDGEPAPLQKTAVGGAKPLEVSTQLVKPTVPAPVTDVMARLLAYVIPGAGGAVGNVKFWATIQSLIVEVPGALSVIVRTEPSSRALSGPPGEFVLALNWSRVTLPAVTNGHVPGPTSLAPVKQTVWVPPGTGI
jgi:hypothetical protein